MSSIRSKKNKKRAAARRRRRNRIAALVLAVCMSAAAYLGWKAIEELGEREQGNDYYESLAVQIGHDSRGGTQREKAQIDMQGEMGVGMQGRESALDFETLWQTCPDVVGWIQLEGEWLDYPVVQGEDNEFYLNHLPNGWMNEAGSIMMDAACNANFSSELTILHGHHMNRGSMFGNLDKYRDEQFYLEHPTLRLYTPDGDFDVELIAAWTLDGMEFGYPTQFATDGEFEVFLQQARENSTFVSDVQVERGDRLLMLSTCAYDFRYARFTVLGKIIME